MKANAYFGPYDMRIIDTPEPTLEDPSDVVVRLRTGAICGSDLHIYHGRYDALYRQRKMTLPKVVGHEFVGVVEETGSAVRHLATGDRVVGAFRTACGRCEPCRRDLPAACTRGRMFGMDIGGAMAQYVRVPDAESTLEKVPDTLNDGQAILVGDVLATGYMAAETSQITAGDMVAVFGCGPVGLCAQICAGFFGPAAVFAVDRDAGRLEHARAVGSIPVDAAAGDPSREILRLTGGRGVDAAIEAVGAEATLRAALDVTRPFGHVSVVGVFVESSFDFPLHRSFLRGITLTMGRCHVQRYMPRLLGMIGAGKIDLTRFTRDVVPLADAPAAFARFDERQTLKVLLAC